MARHARPPASVSSQDVQNTLNCALGNLGGKQKSWMVDPSAQPAQSASALHHGPAATRPPIRQDAHSVQPRRRGRPRKDQQSTPATAPSKRPAHSSPTLHALPFTRTPSTSSSPHLANLVSPQHADRRRQSHVANFPSPRSREEYQVTCTRLPTPPLHEPSGGQFVDADSRRQNPAYNSSVADTPLEPISADLIQNAPREAPLQQFRPTNIPPQEHTPDQDRLRMAESETNASPRSTGSDRVRRAPLTSVQRHHGPTLQQANSPSPSLKQVSSEHGPLPDPPYSSQSVQVQLAAVPFQPHAQPTPRTWYTQQDCWQAIHRFETTQTPSSRGRDVNRLLVLKTAIQQQDWFYLTLHQYYCILDVDRTIVPMALLSQPRLPQAMQLLRDVLGANNNLSTVYLDFFATFPAPIEQVAARWPVMFEQQGLGFLLFLTYSPDIQTLKHTCDERGFPLLAHEMIVNYKIASSTFQRLLFTSCLRWICRGFSQGPYDPYFETKTLTILEKNRVAFYQHALRPQQEPFEEGIMFGRPLRKLVKEHEAALRNQTHSLASRSAGSGLLTPTLSSNDKSAHQQPLQGDILQMRIQDRPRSRPALQSNASVSSLSTQRSYQSHGSPQSRPGPSHAQRPRTGAPLLPPSGWTQPLQRTPNPVRFGLHQAHLRSPVLKAPSSPRSSLFCFAQGFIKQPVRLSDAVRAIETLCFTLTATEMSTIAREVTNELGCSTRAVTEASKMIRLRCIKWTSVVPPSEHEWAIADTAWIPYSYMRFNDTALEQRRKVHYGKDQPIDMTQLVQEGVNTLEITVMSASTETLYTEYLVAIESLGIQTRDSIKEECLSRRVPASTVLESIKQKFSDPGASDDDDVAIVDASLNISIYDPFSASSICDIPVRTKSCAHNDCFDLEIFLNSRTRTGDVTRADVWRCPICAADARPSQLIVDGFLEEVKRELESKGLGNTRTIVVGVDGTWKPKLGSREGVSDETPPPEAQGRQRQIIDLSD